MSVTNKLGIILEILNNYPWTRLAVRIIGAIKRQFFHMVTHVFDNSNLSKEIFPIDTWRAVICSLGHGPKHMLTILPAIQGVPKNLLRIRETVHCCLVVKFCFSRVSDKIGNKWSKDIFIQIHN